MWDVCIFPFASMCLWGSKDGKVKGCAIIFSRESSKVAACCWTTIDRRMMGPTKKKKKKKRQKKTKTHGTCPRAKEKFQQDCTRGEFGFITNSYKPYWECSNKIFCAHIPRDLTETDLPLSDWMSPAEAWVSRGLTGKRGSDCYRSG